MRSDTYAGGAKKWKALEYCSTSVCQLNGNKIETKQDQANNSKSKKSRRK